MRYETQTYSFHCFEAGDRSRPVVLFLHGFLGKGSDWAGVANRLSDEFYCLAPDLPGHGQTHVRGTDDLFTMENTAQGLYELTRQLGSSLYAVAGYSMGGRLALYFAATFPHALKRLVLESTSPGLRTEEERAARRQHWMNFSKTGTINPCLLR
jgi:2-succinyl-6-hydroxy-2,4-cyclohexadiene-1-carboxylate synthase